MFLPLAVKSRAEGSVAFCAHLEFYPYNEYLLVKGINEMGYWS